MPPSGRSCLRVRQLRAGAADHQPSVCNVAETAEPDMLPGGSGRAGPRSCNRGLPRSPAMSAFHTRCGISLEGEECHPEQFNADMVEERGEPFLLPLPCDL